MLVRLRREYALPGVAGLQLMALFVAWQEEARQVWLMVLPSVALLAVLAWLFALRRWRAIGDTPTSRIESAAQGYVEIVGAGQAHEETPLLSPFTQLPCLWYRSFVYRRENDKWVYDHGLESRQFLEIDDGSGRCIVDPEGAEILSQHKETRQVGDWRHVEYLLLQGDRLYALGQFRTLSGGGRVLDPERDVGGLLGDWKQDQAALKARFDLDRDGEISAAEWALARQAARREVARQHAELRAAPARHYLEKPRDGRLFLIANIAPERLARKYVLWAWAQLLVLLGTVLALVWVWRLA